MRILQINMVYKNGGSTGRIVYDLSQTIKENGHESYVAFGYEYVKTSDKYTYKIESIPYLKYNILKTRLFGRHGFYNIWATKKLLRWISKIKPDIIHLHNLHCHYVNVELLFNYIKKNNIPVVWTLHDCWSFTGWCAYFDYAGCDKWKTGCYYCPNKKEYPFTWFFDRSKENYEKKKKVFTGVEKLTIVTPSEWLAKLVKQSFLKEYPVRVINNGIDLNVFKPNESNFRQKHKLEKKKIVLAIANSFEPRKGIEYILQLPQRLGEEYVVVLVGVNEKEKSRLPDGCIGILRTNSVKELAEIYSAADVFINPTLEDNFPTTNLEALACGTPVITFRTGGSAESVIDGCGSVVEKGDIDSFIIRINEIVNGNRKSQKENCVNRAQKIYEKQYCFNKYISIYGKLLDVKHE